MQVCLSLMPRCPPVSSCQSNHQINRPWQTGKRETITEYLQQCLHSRELIISGHQAPWVCLVCSLPLSPSLSPHQQCTVARPSM